MSNPLGYEILGAVKVKDGLFIGDELSSQDLEFVVANKVTHIINCCGRQVPNHWEPIGVVYLTYYWADSDSQIILDQRDAVAKDCFAFIEEALAQSESVLVHSVKGQSRACCVLSAYMMRAFNWGLKKTMEFLSSRRPDLNLKPCFLQQLSAHERRLMQTSKHRFTLTWDDPLTDTRSDSEELLLRNTYLNSQMGPLASMAAPLEPHHPRLLWLDGGEDDKTRLEVPSGGIRAHCRRGPRNEVILTKILKWPDRPRLTAVEREERRDDPVPLHGSSLLSRPTTASSEAFGDSVKCDRDVHAATLPRDSVLVSDFRDRAPDDRRLPPGRDPRHDPRPAWGDESFGSQTLPLDRSLDRDRRPERGGGGGYPDRGLDARRSYDDRYRRADEDDRRNAPSSGLIASSLAIGSKLRHREDGRRDPSPARLPKRDPSPRTRDPRDDRRAESPLRVGPVLDKRGPSPLRKLSTPPLSSGFNAPHMGGGIGGRTGAGSGMGAFRTGGPVKAKADVFGQGDGLRRSTRPATAPSTRTRPASPLARPASSSRPVSPSARPLSPVGQGPVPLSSLSLDRTRQKSLSSHMRRAPSPTPAFNRHPSPGKPRWRM